MDKRQWICSACSFANYWVRDECHKCKAEWKGGEKVVVPPKRSASQRRRQNNSEKLEKEQREEMKAIETIVKEVMADRKKAADVQKTADGKKKAEEQRARQEQELPEAVREKDKQLESELRQKEKALAVLQDGAPPQCPIVQGLQRAVEDFKKQRTALRPTTVVHLGPMPVDMF
eukprot:TRINITY_DN40308_c0_g1_i2.p2 TRINITY_DN40308_c0_g1~~TRINITY_DN40308_c0_g1_i2.p2  ORF type:complete len:174 (-),score=66.38 TRINITY_DN40308_c0_g1_i2:221-742(-)